MMGKLRHSLIPVVMSRREYDCSWPDSPICRLEVCNLDMLLPNCSVFCCEVLSRCSLVKSLNESTSGRKHLTATPRLLTLAVLNNFRTEETNV